jgi:glycosyltransferase involved in cell wall biosynthesis
MSRSTIVIPCYDEAARLRTSEFEEFARAHDQVQLLFINDGSRDSTERVLQDLCAKLPESLRMRSLERNSGKAEAVRQGLIDACGTGADYVGFWDADLATPLHDILVFAQILDSRPDLQWVVGSRVNLLGRSVHRALVRHWVGRIFATAATAVLRLPIYDTQCGAKMFRATREFAALLNEPFLSRWIFDVELIARLVRARRGTGDPPARDVIFEHPLMEWTDVKGSKIRFTDFFRVGADLVRIWWRYMR